MFIYRDSFKKYVSISLMATMGFLFFLEGGYSYGKFLLRSRGEWDTVGNNWRRLGGGRFGVLGVGR